MTAPALELRAVSRRFGTTVAVDEVSLSVADGELLSLVGPSGCGKSTLLLLLAGLLAPDSGTVEVGGQQVAGPGCWVPPERRQVGVVFQDAALFPHLTVADNIAFGLRRGRDRGPRVDELLGLVALPGLGRRFPHELSGGQQQRVALARALAPQPSAVLFDEAFGNLDTNLRGAVREQTVDVLRAAGAAGVFVTHDQTEALAVGDRVAVMRDGRLQQVDDPAAAFHRPANRFCATFLGDADFVRGEQRGELASTPVGELAVVPARSGPEPVDVMLRPHEVTFSPDAAGTVRVVGREFRGATYLYALRLPSGVQLRSLQPHTVDVASGTTVRLTVEAGHPVRAFAARD